ncbi:hypothetical protein ABGB12_25820 [Actinocorallia sp. B10E7]|uniref:hypothetical protein n=1 Tax=Actinocorallia sp. B10E7 TaxID=3153558 RepID=UPI00325DC814
MSSVKMPGFCVWKALRNSGEPEIGCSLHDGTGDAVSAAARCRRSSDLSQRRRTTAMADLVLIALTIAVFAVLGLVVKAVGRL